MELLNTQRVLVFLSCSFCHFLPVCSSHCQAWVFKCICPVSHPLLQSCSCAVFFTHPPGLLLLAKLSSYHTHSPQTFLQRCFFTHVVPLAVVPALQRACGHTPGSCTETRHPQHSKQAPCLGPEGNRGGSECPALIGRRRMPLGVPTEVAVAREQSDG